MLWGKYDLVILDLDGVVYIGDEAVPKAIDSLNQIVSTVQISAATNNASRTCQQVGSHLRSLGLKIEDGEIVTSAQAGAQLLISLVPEHSQVLVVGGFGVEIEVKNLGFHPIRATKNHESNAIIAKEVAAVVQGHGVDTTWWDLNTAAMVIAAHKPWIATNRDSSVPTPYGLGPGNGAFVKMLMDLTGEKPLVAGKPEKALFVETIKKFDSSNALVIGDRIDTDIQGANNCGLDSLLVLTGVHSMDDIDLYENGSPTYIANDLSCLISSEPPPDLKPLLH